ncbi:hypothetical protein CR983_03895 [Candidatus Saccharibacteria bacterium]|nr:MAG: hypothetical protein CR983_03895 [Candidatus Saccharibacteria bacterium]
MDRCWRTLYFPALVMATDATCYVFGGPTMYSEAMAKIFTAEENAAWARQLPGKMTSSCLAILHDEKVVMVKARYKDHWTFPSGIVDDKESPKQTALRETFEETGLRISAHDCDLLGVVYTASNGSDRDRFNFAFWVSVPSDNLKFAVPNDEISEVNWVPFEKVATMSGGKGSYQKFQSILLGENVRSSYVEIL